MRRPKQCPFCGHERMLTQEHIPPKAIFPSPRPSDTVTVMACEPCNSATKNLDSEFGVFVAFLANRKSPEGTRLWQERVRSIQSDQSIRRDLISRRIPDEDSPGMVALAFSPQRFEPIYEKCARGFYFKLYQRSLPVSVGFDWFYPTRCDPMTAGMIQRTHTRAIGRREQFYVGVAAAEESADVAAAALIFYDSFVVVGITANLPNTPNP